MWVYIAPATGVLVEGLLVWRLAKNGMFSRYPYLTAFVLYNLGCTLLLVGIIVLLPMWFASSDRAAELLSTFLRLLVIWEIMRNIFSPNSTARDFALKFLTWAGVIILPILVVLCRRQASLSRFRYTLIPPAFEQYFTLSQALVLSGIALIAGYYGIQMGRNIRGLTVGFGIYLLAYATNFLALQAVGSFLRYWQFLSPVFYIGLLLVWLWAFWDYAPNPDLKPVYSPNDREIRRQWEQVRNTTTDRRKPS